MSFTPPYPSRQPPRSLTVRVWRMRENLLSIFNNEDFAKDTIFLRVLRLSVLVCNSPKTVKQVFIDDAQNFESKSPQMVHALRPLLGNGLFVSDGEHWAKHRRIIAPLTHISRLNEFVPAMNGAIDACVEKWTSRMGQELDVLAEMALLTADVISRSLFGGRLGAAAAAEVVSSFAAFQRTVGQLDLVSLLDLPDSFPRWQSRATVRAAERIKSLVSEMLSGLEAAGDEGRAVLASLMADAFRAEGVSESDIRDEATVILMAGHETTANTLAWAWYCLSQDEDSWRTLAEEVRALGHPPRDLDDVARLPFTRAVISETLRLFPPVPFLARRAREAREIGGHHVPARSLVMIVPWVLHRHANIWRDPDLFDPRRFMPEQGGAPDRYAYVPFSIGPRICSGMAFAQTESILCLARLAQVARPMLRPGHDVMPSARLTLRPGHTLPMTLTPGALAR